MRVRFVAALLLCVPTTAGAAVAVNDDSRLWTEGRIPYRICEFTGELDEDGDPAVRGCDQGGRPLHPREAGLVRQAIQLWNGAFSRELRFVEADRLPIRMRGVLFERSKESTRCSTTRVGRPRLPRRTRVRIGSHCNPFAAPSTPVHSVSHEMMHVAGFYHEQQRPDRNRYVRVDEPGILGGLFDEGSSRQWATWRGLRRLRAVGSYDFKSLMHYPVANPDRVTLTDAGVRRLSEQRIDRDRPGRRDGFSQGDAAAIRLLYWPAARGRVEFAAR